MIRVSCVSFLAIALVTPALAEPKLIIPPVVALPSPPSAADSVPVDVRPELEVLQFIASEDFTRRFDPSAPSTVNFYSEDFNGISALGSEAGAEAGGENQLEPEYGASEGGVSSESGFVLNGAALMALSEMSPEQIRAVAMVVGLSDGSLASLLDSSGAADPVSPEQSPQAPGLDLNGGVPAFGEDLTSYDIDAPLDEPDPQDVVDVDFENWVAGSDAGGVYIERTDNGNSRAYIGEGAIVGKFGLVVEVSAAVGDVRVVFDSGQAILDPENFVSHDAVVDAAPVEVVEKGPIILATIDGDAAVDTLQRRAASVPRLRPDEAELEKMREAAKQAVGEAVSENNP